MDLDKVKLLLMEALERETPRERADFVKEVAADDSTLKAELESLLWAHETADDFLEAPAPELIARVEDGLVSEAAGTVIGQYKLLERIGEGGMAVVYMADQTHPLRRRVALKIVKLGMDTKEVIARFEAERQALAMMDHPNIAKVLDAGATDTGRPYFVMELVRGVSVTEYCDRNKLGVKDRLALFLLVCNAVHHAHQKGIIHRDLKPSNIMVTLHDGQPVPKVIDFGIAKAVDQKLTEKTVFTRYAQMIGTPEYMSPEQAEMSGLDVDTRTDIYSLGIVLYELLTGIQPFTPKTLRSASFEEILRIIREEEPLRPSTHISTLGAAAEDIAARRDTNVASLSKQLQRELEWIPLKAMRKDRTRRYASASELAKDIQNYLNDQPLLAGPESASYRLKKTLHKYRVQAIVVSVVAAVLVISLTVGIWLNVDRIRAREVLEDLTHQAQVQERLSAIRGLYAAGRCQDAINEIENKFDEQDLNSEVQLLRAQLLVELGQFEKAEAEFLRLSEAKNETASSAHYSLARLYVTADPSKADRHEKLAESILPRSKEAYYLRAMTAASADEAIDWLSKTLELDPKYYPALTSRAYAYYSLKAFQKMAEDAAVLVSQRPADWQSLALRAIARRETGQLSEAVQDHDRAIQLCPMTERPKLIDQRRETHARNGDYRLALADARRYTVLNPDDPMGQFHVFTALVALGEYDKAQAVYRGLDKWEFRRLGHFQGWIEAHVLDLLSQGKAVTLPPKVASRSPFYLMQQSAELCALLKKTARPLPVSDGFWLDGEWSPDGKNIVYTRYRAFSWLPSSIEEVKPDYRSSIEIMEIESGQTPSGISSYGSRPLWSPDGKFVAFNHRQPDEQRVDVCLVSAAGGRVRRLSRGVALKWSRDSKHIYFVGHSDRFLYSIAIDIPEAQPLLVLEREFDRYASHRIISPNEDLIISQSRSDIRILTLPEGQEVARWRFPWPLETWSTQLQWHPNGKTVILNSKYFDNQMGMVLFDVERAEATHVFNLTRPWCRTLLSPDGSRLIIRPFDAAPWIMDIDPKKPLKDVLGPALTTDEFLEMLRKKWNERIAESPSEEEYYVSRAVVAMAAKDYAQVRKDLSKSVELIKDANSPAGQALDYWTRAFGQSDTRQSEIWQLVNAQKANKSEGQETILEQE